ncbi:MAG: DoxX family protein [Cyclobacteriaceae bacterium]|nr:DoxX family protein [Cyclobacteriaceae bacterium]
MKRLFETETKGEYLDVVTLILRISVAIFMITHGFPKLNKLLAGGEIHFADPIGLGAAFSLALVVFSEFFCSILIGIGLATRLASIPLIITMAVAAFVIHGADPIGKKELAILYLVIYLTLLIVGSRKYSVDYFIAEKYNK